MSKKSDVYSIIHEIDPTECPFREFRDNELSADFWGLGPAGMRASHHTTRTAKPPPDHVWVDEQAQPLPRSLRMYLHGWVRAEELAERRWEADISVFEELGDGKLSPMEIQVTHAQVLTRSSFCRRVFSACYMLEKVDNFTVEHQWENFTFNISPEGWRARYHIYSPGMKPGGGNQHRPVISKNGCYLVRLYYLGAWRCVWVNDQVPVDANDSPLLPFSPQYSRTSRSKQAAVTVNSNVVYLWPLLLCKAFLKLAAPDMNCEDTESYEDELMPEFNLLHSLTGSVSVTHNFSDAEHLWKVLLSEVPVFAWDDDDDTLTGTIKTKSTKKPTTKETSTVKRSSLTSVTIKDTKGYAPYVLPGISPGQEMQLILTMVRDLPLKKPLPEPEVPLWKTYRWVDWARKHGLYDEYECPRTRFLKVSGILKLSHAPHLLDVTSNESITSTFREEQGKGATPKKNVKEYTTAVAPAISDQVKEDMREWLPYDVIQNFILNFEVLYYPSMHNFTSVASNPPIRIKIPAKADIVAPKSSPLYLQIDGPDENVLRVSLHTLHPRVLLNAGRPLHEYIDPAYLILEVFDWFEDYEVPVTKGIIETRGYGSIEVKLAPGRHLCRIWVHSRLHWHAVLLSKSSLLLGTRDVVLSAAVKECPWGARFLLNLGSAFSNWIRTNRSAVSVSGSEKEFYKSYQPDLQWVPEVVGYHKPLLHWMFRQALESVLKRKLTKVDFNNACAVLRRYFCDPDFGLPPRPCLKSLRHVHADPCDCMSLKDIEDGKEQQLHEEVYSVDQEVMDQLLNPTHPEASKICEYATEEMPCGLLKVERDKVVGRHVAATIIQANWRGTRARNCLKNLITVSPEIVKCIMDNAFGNIEVLSELMNEFFIKYPGAKSAYSVASALSGTNCLRQYFGTVSVTPKCKWLPYFQAVFHCHAAVKVHLDVKSPYHGMVTAYDNDTGVQMPHGFSAHVTYDFEPNDRGYTIMGHATLSQPNYSHADVNWQLTVLCSLSGAFHVCDNDIHQCRELPLPSVSKFHVDEMFIPNRRNILGGIQILVNKQATISFRAAATTELKMEAVLRTSNDGQMVVVGRCSGVGELHWPYIRLEPTSITHPSASHINLPTVVKQRQAGIKARSATKVKDGRHGLKEKLYYIDVIAPDGWPLTLAQWSRVDECRNSVERHKGEADASHKKLAKEKGGLAKDKEKSASVPHYLPLPGDAYIELECSLGPDCSARRDDERDLQFLAERRAWSASEPGRSVKCAKVRKEFRDEFLVESPAPAGSTDIIFKESEGVETLGEGTETQTLQGPSPATELVSDVTEISAVSEEELFLNMPEELKDKFIPLYFVPLCTKERAEAESIIVTSEMTEAAEVKRREEINEALERTREMQAYNENYVLQRHKIRCQMLEKYYTHAYWSPELTKAFEERDDAIAQESLNRTLSATKKKQEVKKK